MRPNNMYLIAASVLCLLATAVRGDDTTIAEAGGTSFPAGAVTSETSNTNFTTVSMPSSTTTIGSNSSSAIHVTCDGQLGPAGVSECVLLSPTYNNYQWATCLSNDYIRLISANKDHCQDPNAKYCWFQCMLENYNSMGPNVRDACRCSRDVSVNPLALPSTCYSPDGSVCDWYTNCLAAKFQCNNTSAGNAVQYGFNFCRMYLQYYKQLSAAGQQWMDSVRRCLLGCMVPLLRQYNTATCDNITKIALASQTSCYLGRGCYGGEDGGEEPSEGNSSDESGEQSDGQGNGNSICNLPSSDFFQVIQMINNSFSDYTAGGESLCGALNTFWKCPGRNWNYLHRCVRNIVVSVKFIDTTPIGVATPYAVPNQLTSKIAVSQNWNAKGIQALGCLTHWPDNTNNQLVINVVVVTKDNKHCMDDAESIGNNGNQNNNGNGNGNNGNGNGNGNNGNGNINKKNNGNQNNPGHQKNSRRKRATDVDLDQIVSDFQNEVASGRVVLDVDGKSLYVTGTGECRPDTCSTSTNFTVAAPAAPTISDCNSQTGPAGVNECVLLSPTYNDYQWATCLSNDYIRLISANKDLCQDPNAKYCWFQCMLENYNSMGPNVRGVCNCSPNANSTALALPATCYSPDGSVCDWYTNCLAAKYQCNNTSAGNAFEYGFNFCRMYLQYYKQLSAAGQQWMDSVRRCLMGCMVPLLRPYNTLTCENVTKLATATQASCYLGHGCYGGNEREDHDDDQGNWNSICNLPPSDFFQVLQMINDSFVDFSSAGESLCGALNTLRSCASHRWNSLHSCVRAIVVSVKYMDTVQPTIAAPYAAPSRITSQIAQTQNWNAQGLQSLGCLTQWPTDLNGELIINVVVITKDNNHCIKQAESAAPSSQAKQNAQRRKRSTTDVDLDQVISDFQQAVQSGKVVLNVDGKPVYVTGTGNCDLLSCSNVTAVSVKAPATPSGSSRLATGSTGLLVITAMLLSAFVNRLAEFIR